MKVYVASDHAGFALKRALVPFLVSLGHEAIDLGPAAEAPEDDYPDLVGPAADAVARDPESRAIVLGGSGEGEAIVANRRRGVRAAVYYGGPKEIVRLSRDHNDANVLALGARFLSEEEAKEAVALWLATPFSGEERHSRRIGKIDLF